MDYYACIPRNCCDDFVGSRIQLGLFRIVQNACDVHRFETAQKLVQVSVVIILGLGGALFLK